VWHRKILGGRERERREMLTESDNAT